MNQISLRLRLLLAWAIFIALTLQIVGFGLQLLYERSITKKTTAELTADLRQLERGMEIAQDGKIRIVREPTDPQFDIVSGGRYWQISEGSRVLLKSRSLGVETLNVSKISVDTAASFPISAKLVGPAKQTLFAILKVSLGPGGKVQNGRQLLLVGAVDAKEIEEDTGKFAADLFRSLAALAALLLIGAWVHVTIGLRPLETLRAQVATVRSGAGREIAGNYPEEVMPLVAETNALLAAQEKTITAARERAGDLAHGLNTPLAVMAAKSRELKRKGEIDIAIEIDQQIEKMRGHVERELARARARGPDKGSVSRIDAAALTRNIISALDSLPRDVPIDWLDELPDTLSFAMDSDDFNNLVGNLLENAQKWARSRVRVSTRIEQNAIELLIEDDGPGVADDDYERVLRRGERSDTNAGGSGLGLAIVSDLVGLYRGILTLSRSDLGGLKASVTVPTPLSI